MSTEYDEMTVEQLTALLDDLDAERLRVREQSRQVVAVRNRKIAEDHAAEFGLTSEGYTAAKAEAISNEVPLQEAVKQMRRKAVQVTKAQPVDSSVVARGNG